MKQWSVEAKVGLVTLAGVLIFTYVVITLAHAEIFGKPGFTVYTTFADGNGLQEGNSVCFVGVPVGKIQKVIPSRQGVAVTMKINKETEIPVDSRVAITTNGLLGEKIINITPGKDETHLLKEGDTLQGTQSKTMDDMMDSAGKLMGNANKMIENINAVIGDAAMQQSMRGTMHNIEAMTGQTSDMLNANAANIQQITANMAAMTGQINQSLQQMDGDGATSANIRQMAENMKNITDRFDSIARSMEKITTDPQSQTDIQTTLHNTAQISEKVNNILSGSGNMQVQGDVGVLYNDSRSETGAFANFRVHRDRKFVLLGAEQIGNGTHLNAQYGSRGEWFTSRFGFINGELGAGFDFFETGPFRFSLEGYDPDDWRYRLKAQYRIMPDMYLFGQFTRPMGRDDGGNYYGVTYAF